MEASTPFRRLAETLHQVSRTSRKLEKVDSLAEYFHSLDDDDLAWACTFLTGAPFPAGDPRQLNIGWAALVEVVRDLSGHTDETLHGAYLRHGDLGEVAEELFQSRRTPAPLAAEHLALRRVHEAFEGIAAAAGKGSRGLKVAALRRLFADATPPEVKYLVKIITSDMRVGLKEGLLEEAIARAFGPRPVLGAKVGRRDLLPLVRRANMLISHIGEVAVLARHERLGDAHLVLFRPFHFMLAETIFTPEEAFVPLRGEEEEEEERGRMLVEDKYDGIRAQVHKADGRIAIFSRTLDDITRAFPELLPDLEALADRYVADGEILAWRGEAPLSFALLQQRLRRSRPGRLIEEVPVVLFAFDLLHVAGEDLLTRPLRERRDLLARLTFGERVRPSHATLAADPQSLAQRFRQARDRGNEGLVVKRLGSPYAPRRRGRQWMKLKEELATLDVVVVAAEHGHGRRAGVLSDVTFAVRDGDRLATIGKAYSGLTDQEIAGLTHWFLSHTIGDLGRVKLVEPAIVLEIAFDAVTESDRHDSGFALRFPRIKRWRSDKSAAEISTLDDVRRIHARQIVRPRAAGRAVAQTVGGGDRSS